MRKHLLEGGARGSQRAGLANGSRGTTKIRAGLGFVAALVGLPLLQAAEMPVGHPTLAKPISAADLAFFESKIRPVLVDNCYKCHSKQADKVRGGFLID